MSSDTVDTILLSQMMPLKKNSKVPPDMVSLQQTVKQEIATYFAENGFQFLKNGELYPQMFQKMEKALFEATLNYADGNTSLASRILGISRATLRQRLALFGLDKKSEKK